MLRVAVCAHLRPFRSWHLSTSAPNIWTKRIFETHPKWKLGLMAYPDIEVKRTISTQLLLSFLLRCRPVCPYLPTLVLVKVLQRIARENASAHTPLRTTSVP